MPPETRYAAIFAGDWVSASRAEPVYVLISKAVKAPLKNRGLIRMYMAREPAPEFFTLCQRYGADLDAILGS